MHLQTICFSPRSLDSGVSCIPRRRVRADQAIVPQGRARLLINKVRFDGPGHNQPHQSLWPVNSPENKYENTAACFLFSIKPAHVVSARDLALCAWKSHSVPRVTFLLWPKSYRQSVMTHNTSTSKYVLYHVLRNANHPPFIVMRPALPSRHDR